MGRIVQSTRRPTSETQGTFHREMEGSNGRFGGLVAERGTIATMYFAGTLAVRCNLAKPNGSRAEELMTDVETFKTRNRCSRCVVHRRGSTEVYRVPGQVHASVRDFVIRQKESASKRSPSQVYAYAYAAVQIGVLYAHGGPDMSVDIPALRGFARETSAPIAGGNVETGQTLLKTIGYYKHRGDKLLNYAKSSGLGGTLVWLSLLFKRPMTADSAHPEDDFFIQLMPLNHTLRNLEKDNALSHSGHKYCA